MKKIIGIPILIAWLGFGVYANHVAAEQNRQHQLQQLKELRRENKKKGIISNIRKPTKTSMLEYCKIIMKTISFDKRLFKKEYKKTFNYLTAPEQVVLKQWLREATITNGTS